VVGFLLLAALGYLEALLFNGIASIAGGFKVVLDRAEEEAEESKPE
jgi:hypothetical protein